MYTSNANTTYCNSSNNSSNYYKNKNHKISGHQLQTLNPTLHNKLHLLLHWLHQVPCNKMGIKVLQFCQVPNYFCRVTYVNNFAEKDTGTQSENTESETTSQAEGKKKRQSVSKRKQRDPTAGRPPKKPKKGSPATTPPPPAPEKKKQAAKKPKKPSTTTATAKGKKGKANTETTTTPQLSQLEPTDTSNIQLSSSLPMMITPTVTNSFPSVESMGNDFDFSSSKHNTDEDMDELGGDIDISMWLSSTSTALAPAPGSAQHPSPSTVDFDKEMEFFSSPATAPAATQKTPTVPFSPSAFPVVDDAVVCYVFCCVKFEY